MKAADELVDIIKDIVQQEINKKDCVVLCEVVAQSADNSLYDVYVVPDRKAIVHGVPNMSKVDPIIGDYCYVYKINNSFSNAFICYVKK